MLHASSVNVVLYLQESRKQIEDQCTVCGQLIAPRLVVAPTAPAVPCEGSHAGPLRKCPDSGQNIASGSWGQQLSWLLTLQQLCQLLVLVYGLQKHLSQLAGL